MPNTGKSSKRKIKKLHKSIFLDRDGVINHDPIGDYIKTWKEFQFLPGVISGLQELTQKDFEIIIVSNQAGVGDGIYSKRALNDITRKMLASFRRSGIRIRGVYYCMHGKNAGCQCRKPEVGLFQKASRNLNYQKRNTFFIGDKISDILAGKRFGLKTVFILTGHGKKDLIKLRSGRINPDLIARNFQEAINAVLANP